MSTDKNNNLEELMQDQIKLNKLPKPTPEYKFHETRRWRFDFAWIKKKIALEIEGGTWVRGRHIHPMGFEKDCEKYNEAAILGWKVIRATGSMVRDGRALEFIKRIIK